MGGFLKVEADTYVITNFREISVFPDMTTNIVTNSHPIGGFQKADTDTYVITNLQPLSGFYNIALLFFLKKSMFYQDKQSHFIDILGNIVAVKSNFMYDKRKCNIVKKMCPMKKYSIFSCLQCTISHTHQQKCMNSLLNFQSVMCFFEILNQHTEGMFFIRDSLIRAF